MCKQCFEYSEKVDFVMDVNEKLLSENKMLREKLKRTKENLSIIIKSLKLTKECFAKSCWEVTKVK
jgi:hypothetical protein